MVGLIQNVGDSLKFGFAQCYGDGFKGFLRMLAMLVLWIIPIVDFIPMGMFLKIFKGEKPDFTNAGQSFIRGLLFFVVSLIYMLIPIILLSIFGGFAVIPAIFAGEVGAAIAILVGGIGAIIALIVAIVFGLIWIPAQINYARNGFAAAFKFSDILGMISRAGVAKYILSYLIYLVVMIIVGLIIGLIFSIPGAGTIIGIIVLILVTVPLIFFYYKYWANRFEA